MAIADFIGIDVKLEELYNRAQQIYNLMAWLKDEDADFVMEKVTTWLREDEDRRTGRVYRDHRYR